MNRINPTHASRRTCGARVAFAFVTVTALLFASVASAQSAPAADVAAKTPAGATFTASGAWTLRTGTQAVVLDAPEGDAHIAVVDAGEG